MTKAQKHQCAIWPESRATERRPNLTERFTWLVSPRTGGEYKITWQAYRLLSNLGNSQEVQRLRARLTTWLVEMRQLGEGCPLVTTDVIEQVRARRDLHPYERADRLLRYLASVTKHLGARLESDTLDFPAMASISETVDAEEIVFLIRYLELNGYVEAQIIETFGGSLLQGVVVSIDGHSRLADTAQAVDPAQVFVAMWFDPSLGDLYERGIRPAVEATGYSPLRIDQKPDANKIDDEIVAEIRRSRFIVADFTHGDGGARGGVYYEAGLANGLSIPVIFTCREDMFDEIHFDTRQYNHIGWSEPENLVEPLKQRILARIGEGPGLR